MSHPILTHLFHVHAIRSSLATSKGSWQRATTTLAPKITIKFSWDTNVFLCVLSLLYCLLQKKTKLCSVPQSAPLPQHLSWGNVFVYWRRREYVQVWKCCSMYLGGMGWGGGTDWFYVIFLCWKNTRNYFFPCIFYYYYYKAEIWTAVSQDCSNAPSKKERKKVHITPCWLICLVVIILLQNSEYKTPNKIERCMRRLFWTIEQWTGQPWWHLWPVRVLENTTERHWCDLTMKAESWSAAGLSLNSSTYALIFICLGLSKVRINNNDII